VNRRSCADFRDFAEKPKLQKEKAVLYNLAPNE